VPEHRLQINLAKVSNFVRKYRGVGMEGSSDGHAPILLLAVQPGRFFGIDAETRQFDTSDIPYVTPANDNAPTKVRLAARCGALLRRLIDLRRLSRPVT
jgi:hypothetical protein